MILLCCFCRSMSFAPCWSPYGGLSCPVRCSPRRPVAACPGDCRGDRSVEGLSRRGAVPGAGSGTRTGLPAGVQATRRPGPARWCLPECGPGSCFRSRHGTGVPSTTRVRAWSGSSAAGTRPDRPRTTRPARLGRGRAAGGPARPRSLPPGSVPVAAQWSAGYGGVIVDEGLVGDCDRLGRRACCTIHARTRPENMGCWMTRLSQRQVLTFHQDTPVPAEQPKESTPQIRVLNNPPPLGDRLPHTKRNRHRTQTPQSDSLNQTFTTVRETHFTPVSPAKECRWLGQLWSA
mgnify:CR=1 FL=1